MMDTSKKSQFHCYAMTTMAFLVSMSCTDEDVIFSMDLNSFLINSLSQTEGKIEMTKVNFTLMRFYEFNSRLNPQIEANFCIIRTH